MAMEHLVPAQYLYYQAAKFLFEKCFLPLVFRFIPRVLGEKVSNDPAQKAKQCAGNINRSFVAPVTKRIGLAV